MKLPEELEKEIKETAYHLMSQNRAWRRKYAKKFHVQMPPGLTKPLSR